MFRKKRVVLALIAIFILGMATGGFLTPAVFQWMAGNPYSTEVMADRVFNTRFLKNRGMTPDQKEAADRLIERYVLKYTALRDAFVAQRNTVYEGFMFELKNILTPEQYNAFRIHADGDIREREEYHRKMKEEWKAEKEKLKETKQYKYIDSGNAKKDSPASAASNPYYGEDYEDHEDDLFMRYMYDKRENGWTTLRDFEKK